MEGSETMSVEIEGYCEVWKIEQRRARKEHACDACGETIQPGHVYANHFTVFRGDAENVKRCLKCETIYQHLCSLEDDADFQPDIRLACGHTYEENWNRPPPDEIARLAFMTPDEIQQALAASARWRSPGPERKLLTDVGEEN